MVGEQLLDDWAEAWSSHDMGRILPLFTDDVVCEDVTPTRQLSPESQEA